MYLAVMRKELLRFLVAINGKLDIFGGRDVRQEAFGFFGIVFPVRACLLLPWVGPQFEASSRTARFKYPYWVFFAIGAYRVRLRDGLSRIRTL